jgi:hypothetical protein
LRCICLLHSIEVGGGFVGVGGEARITDLFGWIGNSLVGQSVRASIIVKQALMKWALRKYFDLIFMIKSSFIIVRDVF